MSKVIDSWNWKKPQRTKFFNKNKLEIQKGIIGLYDEYWKCKGLKKAMKGDEIYYELHNLEFCHGVQPTIEQRKRIRKVFPDVKKKYVHCDFKGICFFCAQSRNCFFFFF